MARNNGSNAYLGTILGGSVALAAATFVLSGGQWGGTAKVNNDHDLPRITSPRPAR